MTLHLVIVYYTFSYIEFMITGKFMNYAYTEKTTLREINFAGT